MVDRYNHLLMLFFFLFILLFFNTSAAQAATYYISPSGNDANNGQSTASPLATFNKAWQLLMPGDTLLLMDGTYYQSLNPNVRNGTSGSPITIKALNDGKVIIDGQGQRIPVKIGDTWPGPVNSYFAVEGIIAKNSINQTILLVGANQITLKRISAYNANTDDNSEVIAIQYSQNVLVEDCVAAGSGRKMIYVYGSESNNNVIRRCFASWQEWQGKLFNPGHWPWGDTFEYYHGVNNTMENVIAYGMTPGNGLKAQSQDSSNSNATTGNKFLGSVVMNIGMKFNNSTMTWPCPPPHDASIPCNGGVTDTTGDNVVEWLGGRTGLFIYGAPGQVNNTLIQDVFAYGNGGAGIDISGNGAGNRLIRVTAINNGKGVPYPREGKDINSNLNQSMISEITDSKIGGTTYNGGGARLQNRYINGQLTDESLWPWPMDNRIRSEFGVHLSQFLSVNPELNGFSVTANVCEKVLKPNGAVSNCGSLTPGPSIQVNTPSPTTAGCSQKSLGDTDCNGMMNLIDFEIWRKEYMKTLTTKTADFNANGTVDLVDFEIWRKSFLK